MSSNEHLLQHEAARLKEKNEELKQKDEELKQKDYELKMHHEELKKMHEEMKRQNEALTNTEEKNDRLEKELRLILSKISFMAQTCELQKKDKKKQKSMGQERRGDTIWQIHFSI